MAKQLAAMQGGKTLDRSEAGISKVFAALDTDKSGLLELAEMKSGLKQLGVADPTDAQIRELLGKDEVLVDKKEFTVLF